MRILVVSPRLPWPARDGGQLGIAQHLAILAERHSVRLIALDDGSGPAPTPPPDGLESVKLFCERRASPAVSWVQSLGSRWPATLLRYRSPALFRFTEAMIDEWKPDVAIAEHLHLGYLCTPRIPWILGEHNVETLFLERFAGSQPVPLRFLYAIEAARMRALEPEILSAPDVVIAVDEREAGWIREHAPRARVHFVPHGIREHGSPEGVRDGGFLLLGSWRWAPNREAARWFLSSIWPLVRSQDPAATLDVVGAASGPEVFGSRVEGVRWAGEVPDVKPWFERAKALVVPLKTGAGLRIKILEGMAAGAPVVTTSLGAGGLDAEPGTHLLVADEERAMADTLLALGREPSRAREIGEAGRAWVKEHFGMDHVRDLLERAVEDAVARGLARRAS